MSSIGKKRRSELQSGVRHPSCEPSFKRSGVLTPLLAALLAPLFFALAGCHPGTTDPGEVRFLIESSPNNLDLRQGTDAQSERVGALIYDALVRKDEHYQLRPALAASWERPDALTWVFHLRPGVRFHDGRPLTAEDVAWSIRSMTDGALTTAKGGSFTGVTAIEARDPLTVVVHTSHAEASLLFNLSDGLFGVVEKGAGREEGMHPVGTGPFRFVSQVQDKEVVLERNAGYWDGAPKIKRVRFAVVPDTITAALELKKGSADIASNVLTPDMVHALRSASAIEVESGAGSAVFYLNFNATDPALRDTRVRQAVAYAVDRPALIASLWRGEAHEAPTLLPPGHWAAANEAELQRYSYDPARARALLEAAGLHARDGGVRLRLTLKTSTDESTRLVAQAMQQQMLAAGIELKLRPAEFGTFYSDITKGAFQMYLLRWIGSNEDPDILRYTAATSSFAPKGGNRGRFSDARVDNLLREAAEAVDEQARRRIYIKVQRVMSEELPCLPLWYPNNEVIHARRLLGVKTNPGGSFAFLRTAALAP